MAGVLLREARLTGETFTLLAASEKTAESFVRAMEGAQRGAVAAAGNAGACGARTMRSEEVRFMWMFVSSTCPSAPRASGVHATRFRNFLKDDGFMMLQWSVYVALAAAKKLWISTSGGSLRACRHAAACAHERHRQTVRAHEAPVGESTKMNGRAPTTAPTLIFARRRERKPSQIQCPTPD